MGLPLVGMSGDGVHSSVGGGGVEDQGDGLGLGVLAGEGQYPGAVGLGPGLAGVDVALPDPVKETGEHDVGPVNLVAGSSEVLSDWSEFGAAVEAVLQQPGGLRLVRVGGGTGVCAQVSLEVEVDRPGLDEADQAAGEVRLLGPGGQPDGQPPCGQVVDNTAAAVSSAMPSAMRRSYRGRSGSAHDRTAGNQVVPVRRYVNQITLGHM